MNRLIRFLPFLNWLGELKNFATLRADFVAGLTVALVIVPQSMAYAQLAGLPAEQGLYASFLPVMIAALLGSSRQLATGPVAIVSLLTAAAVPSVMPEGGGLQEYIMYSSLLALMVGLLRFMIVHFIWVSS